MFIKRDLRKIEQVLADTTNEKKILKFSNRKEEFQSNIKILCRESYIKTSFTNLLTLNLYANDISNIEGIGIFSNTPIEEMNLGNNKISKIPLEFGTISTLRNLYLEDNELDSFPITLCQLTNLHELRLSGNQMSYIPQSISSLQQLQILSLDNNELEDFPVGVLELSSLTQLWLRQNKITKLPSNLDCLKCLEILSVSSNALIELPECLRDMNSLTKIYANCNSITAIPLDVFDLPHLKVLNLANNAITLIPDDSSSVYDPLTGLLTLLIPTDEIQVDHDDNDENDKMKNNKKDVVVTLLGNPIVII